MIIISVHCAAACQWYKRTAVNDSTNPVLRRLGVISLLFFMETIQTERTAGDDVYMKTRGKFKAVGIGKFDKKPSVSILSETNIAVCHWFQLTLKDKIEQQKTRQVGDNTTLEE